MRLVTCMAKFGEPAQAAGFGVPVHQGASGVEQNRAAGPGAYRPVDGAADDWRQHG